MGITMKRLNHDDPLARSADLKEINLTQLGELFPEALSDGYLDIEILKQFLPGNLIEEYEEKYGLNWHGKRRARELALAPSVGTLRPCPEDSVDWNTTQNLMIEGDNLEVLKLLQKGYAGKVKLIYIDPPYNTGKDFVYPDNFQDNIKNYLELSGQADGVGRKLSSNSESSGRFHTNWLNMIYPRLKLARNLLKDDGVIFISIDDVEVANLRKVCDEVFGEENFVATVIWEKVYSPRMDAQGFSVSHDYLVAYSKMPNFVPVRESFEQDQNAFKYFDETTKKRYRRRSLRKEGSDSRREDSPSLWFALTAPDGAKVFPFKPDGTEGRWRWSFSTYQQSQDKVEWVQDLSGQWQVYVKQYLDDDAKRPQQTIWSNKIVGHTHQAIEAIGALLGQKVFDTPKPQQLIEKCLEVAGASSGDICLDFFAGSGTTGHAVMAQNAVDGLNRRHILVQLPEPLDPDNKNQKVAADYCDQLGKPRTIAELTKERLRRAGRKVREESPMFTGDIGFRVFKLDSSNIRAWEPDRDDLPKTLLDSIDHLKADRTESDILFELLLKLGLDLTVPIDQKAIAGKLVHSIGAGTLIVCLAPEISGHNIEPLALGLIAWYKELSPSGETRVIFRDSAFADDVAKTNITAILQQHGLGNVSSL